MEQKKIFRKESLDRVSSPEQLNDYIRVSSPGVWLLLAAVVVLLLGICFWGVFGRIETTIDTVAMLQNGQGLCFLSPEQAKKLAPGMPVRAGEAEGSILSVASTPMQLGADTNAYALYAGGMQPGDQVVAVAVALALPDGTYPVCLIAEQLSPISFITN